jgi:TolA-binding protein
MSDADDLDEALRAKLRTAAELAHSQAQAPHYAALSAALARESRALRMRRRLQAGGLVLGLAAAAALALYWPAHNTALVANEGATDARCELPGALSIATLEAGKQQLALGRFGSLVASADSHWKLETVSPCLVSVYLERGELAGDLNSLKPAQLRVRTPHGNVVVRGTRFSVRADAALEVVLLSGRVDIEDEGQHTLEPQHVFRKAGKQRATKSVQTAEAQHLEELLRTRPLASAASAPSAAVAAPAPLPREETPATADRPPPPSRAGELLARAESERRRGEIALARALYRQASSKYHDDDAEVALLRWVRLELESRAFGSAERVLRDHTRRFAAGKLRAEAAWLDILILREQGQIERARSAARKLLGQFPIAPQADAARQWLAAP